MTRHKTTSVIDVPTLLFLVDSTLGPRSAFACLRPLRGTVQVIAERTHVTSVPHAPQEPNALNSLHFTNLPIKIPISAKGATFY